MFDAIAISQNQSAWQTKQGLSIILARTIGHAIEKAGALHPRPKETGVLRREEIMKALSQTRSVMQYPLPHSSFGPSLVGAAQNGNDEFRDMTLSVDCRPRMADDVVWWGLAGTIAGTVWGTWRGSMVDRHARQILSSRRRKQRAQSKRRREQKGKTSKGRLVGNSARKESEKRRRGDFRVGYAMQQGAMWGLITGSTLGVGRAIWRLTSTTQPMKEGECRDDAIKRLKGNPSWNWGLIGVIAGALMYVAQVGSQEPLQAADAEANRLGLYSIAGGGGAWALSKWFS